MNVKDILRSLLIFFHLDLTKNLEYDRLTRRILKKVIKNHANCIDAGCHKGEILKLMLRFSPRGTHFAFEPIPQLYDELANKFNGKARIFPFALSDFEGETSFQLVKNAPAYSGIRRRRYDIAAPEIEEISVGVRCLDGLIPPDIQVHFIKIDVEGGEFGVLKGARQLLRRDQPVVLFECGMGASDYYGTDPADLFRFLKEEAALNIYTLRSFIREGNELKLNEFINYFRTNKEYYFVASR